jgi:hypothetical protein
MDENNATTATTTAPGTIAASDITPQTQLVTADHPALQTGGESKLGEVLSDVPFIVEFLESQFSHFRNANKQRKASTPTA